MSIEPAKLKIALDSDRDNYAVMGNPVAHSKSPIIHQTFADQAGQELFYQAIHVPKGQFGEAINQFRTMEGKGLNVTVPFKEEAYKLCDHLSFRSSVAMAVNTIIFSADGGIIGDNTDGVGLSVDLMKNKISLQGRRVLILGAGGAVRGVLGPLCDQRPEQIVIANRTMSKAETLAAHFKGNNVSACDLDKLGNLGAFDVIINGTSSGLNGELPPLPISIVSTDTCCYDMVYGDTETVFNQWAKENGARMTLDGLGMLVEQAAEAFYIWRGVKPETGPVIKMLRGK